MESFSNMTILFKANLTPESAIGIPKNRSYETQILVLICIERKPTEHHSTKQGVFPRHQADIVARSAKTRKML